MNHTFLTILTIMLILIPMILGSNISNRILAQKYQHNLSQSFINLIILKWGSVFLISFAIIAGTTVEYSQLWTIVEFVLLPIVSFFYMKQKIFESYNIYLKPGSGFFTPEGWTKAEQRNQTRNTTRTVHVNDSTFIYSYSNHNVIGRIQNDGAIYNSSLGGSFIGRLDNKFIYHHSNGGSPIARYDSSGNVYSSAIGGNFLGTVSSEGIVYGAGLIDKGSPVAKVEGPNKIAAGAAFLSIFK